ncbi:hypothetical protein FHG87_022850 [Trinorchestia longiramus]|nr:hypothetical protein FHG87_022850 [Trinorchestia longiramus]
MSHRGRVVYGLCWVSGLCFVRKDCWFEPGREHEMFLAASSCCELAHIGKAYWRRATKMIPERHNLSYERRLQQLELIFLEQGRVRGQLLDQLGLVPSWIMEYGNDYMYEMWGETNNSPNLELIYYTSIRLGDKKKKEELSESSQEVHT